MKFVWHPTDTNESRAHTVCAAFTSVRSQSVHLSQDKSGITYASQLRATYNILINTPGYTFHVHDNGTFHFYNIP